MVKKQEEMNVCGLIGDKVGEITLSPQDKGRKNKRKLADPSQDKAASLTEFPRYELQDHLSGNDSSEDQLNVEESDTVEWDDPFACYLEELLSSNLLALFLNAMKQVIDCGYTDDDVLKAISGSRLYCGGSDLVSNIVSNALNVLKNGSEGGDGTRDYVFEDLQQLVGYTLVEMISLVKEVRPSLSTVEAMWRLLMCDLNVLQAFEVESSESPGFCLSESSESLAAESNPPNSGDQDNQKPQLTAAQSEQSEPLKFGNFPNAINYKNTHSSGTTSGKGVASGSTVSGAGVKSTSFTLVSDEKLVSSRKGRTKKEIPMLRQKSCVEKIRTYSKGSGSYKAAKFASVGSFLLEKRAKSSTELMARNCSSKLTAELGVKVSLEETSCFVRKKSSKSDSPVVVVDGKGFITALPAISATKASSASKKKSGSEPIKLVPSASERKSGSEPVKLVPSASEKKSGSEPVKLVPSASEKKSVSSVPSSSGKKSVSSVPIASGKKSCSESEEKALVSEKLAPDYYAGIPYDASLGIYVPRDKKDELILKLVPRVSDLQNELQVWTDWANQKVKDATGRLLKDQPELKALRKERELAKQHKKEKQLMEENTMKRLSEMEIAVKNATSQFEKANNTARRLEVEQSLLKKEMEAAKIRAAESAESYREAKERGQRSFKDTQSWEGQKTLLQEELKIQRDKVTIMQKEVNKAKNRQSQIEAALKQEKTAKGKLTAQACAIKKERKKLEALGKAEEERIKAKAEEDMKYYIENIKRLERDIRELKLKSDYSRIVALKKGGRNESKARKRENHGVTKVKRERECVMCLSEEMSVIFLPCAHQVLCFNCNQLHEKEGMMDCPSCRGTIQRRIQARFARTG